MQWSFSNVHEFAPRGTEYVQLRVPRQWNWKLEVYTARSNDIEAISRDTSKLASRYY